MMRYELWDGQSGNIVADFANKAEALAAVRETARGHGRDAATDLFLGTIDEEGDGDEIAAGDALLAMAGVLGLEHSTISAQR